MRLPITEHQLQTQIIHYLQAKGWYVMRLNSGRFSVGEGRNRRFIMGQEKGTPDLLAFKNCPPIFFEVKVGYNKPTIHQKMKMQELEEYGAQCFVVYSLEDVMKVVS